MTGTKLLRLLVPLTAMLLIAGACQQQGDDTTADGGATCPEGDECVEVASGEAIRIGTLLSISGETASLGTDSQRGAELGADYLDGTFDGTAGQIAGFDVEFQHEDDLCAPEGGQSGGRKLASDPTIVAVIGTTCSSSALGVADQILGEASIPLISPSNTSPALTDPGTHNEFYLRTAHNDLIQGAAVATFALEERQAQTAATIHDGSPYADGLQQVFCDVFEAGGGTCAAQEAIQVGDTDFVPLLTRLSQDQLDFLFYPIFLPEGGLITAQAREIQALQDTDLAGADGLLTTDFPDSAGVENAEGVFLSGPSLEFSGDFYNDEFLPAYQDQYGEEPTAPFHAHAFDAFNVVAQAIESVAIESDDGGLLIPRQGLRDALFATEGHEGITGTITCNENGDCQPTATMAVNEVKDGSIDNPIYELELSLEEASG